MALLAVKKKLEKRVVYRLTITDEPNGKSKRRIFCTYEDGTRIHGKGPHVKHPEVILSASDQDEILWSGQVRFEVTLKFNRFIRSKAAAFLRQPKSLKFDPPENPFHRETFIASRGRDGIYRVASGPLDKQLVKRAAEYKFTVTRLTPAGTVDTGSIPLDPHIVVEP